MFALSEEQTENVMPPRAFLEYVMPVYDVRQTLNVWVPAAPQVAYATIKSITIKDLWLARLLTWLRVWPARLAGKSLSAPRGIPGPLFGQSHPDIGFRVLAEHSNLEFVTGAIGKFWDADPMESMRAVAARIHNMREFRSFVDKDYVKLAFSFRVEGEGAGSRIFFELRLACTSPTAEKHFNRCWAIFGRGEHLIMWSVLRTIRHRLSRRNRAQKGRGVRPHHTLPRVW